jgi:hypothetical protein
MEVKNTYRLRRKPRGKHVFARKSVKMTSASLGN